VFVLLAGDVTCGDGGALGSLWVSGYLHCIPFSLGPGEDNQGTYVILARSCPTYFGLVLEKRFHRPDLVSRALRGLKVED
jgi:hypothetical protein